MISRTRIAATGVLLLLASTSASAWTGHGTAYTPRGTYNGAHFGS